MQHHRRSSLSHPRVNVITGQSASGEGRRGMIDLRKCIIATLSVSYGILFSIKKYLPTENK